MARIRGGDLAREPRSASTTAPPRRNYGRLAQAVRPPSSPPHQPISCATVARPTANAPSCSSMEHTFIVMESSCYGFLGHGHGHGHFYGPRIQGQALELHVQWRALSAIFRDG